MKSHKIVGACLLLALATGCTAGIPVVSFPQNSPPGVSVTGPVDEVLRRLRPVLAVRGISCLMCHADVKANVITDFGYGDPWFMGAHQYGLGSDYYGNPYHGWTPADGTKPAYPGSLPSYVSKIEGSVVIPRATISDPLVLQSMTKPGEPTVAPLSLMSFMSNDYYAPTYGAWGHQLRPAMSRVVSPLDGLPPLLEVSALYIGAPTRAQILALDPAVGSSPADQAYAFRPDWTTGLAGLELVGSGTNAYYRNQTGSVFYCEGDLIIKGTLFLRDLLLASGPGGCRIYASDTVFIQGKIQYQNDGSNLQITSAKAIVMGFDYASLENRLVSYPYAHMAPTRGPGTILEKSQSVLAEAQRLGADLVDAATPGQSYSYVTYVDPAGTTRTRVNIGYEHVLLNAPQVHSRYYGPFKGVVVAEVSLFAVGELQFEYDPIFLETPAFPLIQHGILEVVP
ncbi:MAG: hypothetical protein AB7P04_01285 [Bacteriovoracia bacterium]